MPQFSYRARNARGELVEGVLECADRTIAIHQIEQQRYVPIKIEMIAGDGAKAPAQNGARATAKTEPRARVSLKIPQSQLLIFTEQLAHLLQAGMTLDEG